jgi:poly-gamma-glutamate synthesis protein (capsule biosynthesis protein)
MKTSRRVVALTTGLLVSLIYAGTSSSAHADPPLRSFTMIATGDIIAHSAVNQRALWNGNKLSYDYRPMFAEVQPIIQGVDLAICHLEGPIAPPKVNFAGQPFFASPPDIVQSIKDVGYDRCSTATNHSNDKGFPGVTATIAAFEAAGLGHSGTARNAQEAVAPIFDVNGVKVAHLAYTYPMGGLLRALKLQPWWINVIDPDKVIADAADARRRGAEVVIVSFHWGSEYYPKVTKEQMRVADAITKSGQVDLIIGSHAHLLEPIQQVNGKWVVFGMGNFLSNQREGTTGYKGTQDGIIVEFTIAEQAGGGFVVEKPTVIPTWVQNGAYRNPNYKILITSQHLTDPALDKLTVKLINQSWLRVTSMFHDYIAPPS